MLSSADPFCLMATADGVVSRRFYEEIIGLTCISDDASGLVFQLKGVVLRVLKVTEFEPQEHAVHGWGVGDLESEIRALKTKGVRFEEFPCFEQDELGIWETNGAKIAWFRDPDGNLISLVERNRGDR